MHGGHSHCSHGEGGRSPDNFGKAFAVGIALNTAFALAEAVYGYLSGSLALIADAGHNLTDVLSLVLAWFGAVMTRRAPSERYTYGLHGSSILAALGNAMLLLVAVGAVAWEAIQRLWHPPPVAGLTVICVALAGIGVNSLTALLFMRGKDDDLNARAAFIHMWTDAAVSAGVVVAGGAIVLTGWLWLDPAVTLLICVIILLSSLALLRESLDLAVDAVPRGIDPAAVRKYLQSLPGVTSVHDLHIWALSTRETALTVHLGKADAGADNQFLFEVGRDLEERFSIQHATIQIEHADTAEECPLAPSDRV